VSDHLCTSYFFTEAISRCSFLIIDGDIVSHARSSHEPISPIPPLFRTFHFKLNIFACCRPQGLPGHPGPTSWMARDAGDSHPPPSYNRARDPRPDLSIPHKTSRHPHETLARDRMCTTKDEGGDNVRGRWSECTFSIPTHQLKAHASPQLRRCIFCVDNPHRTASVNVDSVRGRGLDRVEF